jgi:uncharacterized membrane protein
MRTACLLWLAACGADGDPADVRAGLTDTSLPTQITCDRAPALDWTNYAEGFFDKSCNGCHSSQLTGAVRSGAPEGVDFDTEAAAIQQADRVRARVLGDQTMPPGGGLTAEELFLLDEWLTCAVGV